jgi:phospholipid/cholesterol/gamma-HCH transport system substrate-binding protein
VSANDLWRQEAPDLGPVREDEEALLDTVPRRSTLREVWVGTFMLAALLAGLTALFLLTDASTFRGRYVLTTVVEDAGGMRRGDPVRMRGVNIGRIQRFDIQPGGVAVRLEIEGEYDVPSGSRVVIRSGDLLGGMVAEVIPGTGAGTLGSGDVVQGSSAAGFANIGNLQAQAETVLRQAQLLLSPTTAEAVRSGALNLDRTLAQTEALIGGQRAEIEGLVASLRRSAAGLEAGTAGGADVARAAARLDSLVSRLDTASAHLTRSGAALEATLARIERGEGTLGRLVVDPALYERLHAAAAQIEALAEDMRANPRRYINVSIF